MDFLESEREPRKERSAQFEQLRRERDRLREELEETRARFRKFTQASGRFASAMRGRMSERRRLDLQYAALDALEKTTRPDEIPATFLEVLGRGLGQSLGVFWVADGDKLRCIETWQPSAARRDALENMCRDSSFTRRSGLPGRVWAENEPLLVDDLEGSDPRSETAAEEGLRGALAVPIRNSGRMLGVAEFFGPEAVASDNGLLRTLSIMGFQAGQFIERRRTEEALRESEARLATDLAGMRLLYDLHARLANETNLDVALGEILAAACEFTDTDRGCVQLVSDDGERLEMFAWRGYADDSPFIENFRHEGSKVACDMARRHGARLIIEDIETFAPLEGTRDREVALAENIRATQSTPLVSRRGEMVGMLNNQFSEPHRPTDDELRLIDLLAWTAADFIERHRAEEALRESEERFRQFAENSEDVLWIVDAETRQLEYLSPAYERIWGEPRDAVLADIGRWRELVHPEDRERAFKGMPRLLGGEIFAQEYRIVRPGDGRERWILDTGFPIPDKDGHTRRVGGVAQDITKRKRGEEVLRESEARLQKAVEIESVGVLFFDSEGVFTQANDAFLRWLGFTRAEFEQRRLTSADVTLPEWMPRTRQALDELRRTERFAPYEKELVRPDGSRWWGLFSGTRLSEDENVEFVVDITDRKRAEGALRENEERLRLAQRAASSGTWEWDLTSEEIRWSEEHRELFGFDTTEPITRERWWEATHPDDVEQLEEAGRRCREKGAEWPEIEYRITRPNDGEGRWINARGRTIRDDTGHPVRILGVSVDVTERKKADEERERLHALEVTARAQAAERERLSRDLHDRVAHEMGIVHQNLQLYEAIRTSSPERAAEKIEVAKRMAKSSLESTRNLSAELRRSEAEDGLEEALREYVEAVTPQDVELKFSFDGDESQVVDHIRGQLYLILCEAIRNSVKHSGCRTMRVGVEVSPAGVSASVEDDGLGFEADETKHGGVGLRSMRERAGLFGGDLQVTSAPGNGTKVSIEVPLGEEQT